MSFQKRILLGAVLCSLFCTALPHSAAAADISVTLEDRPLTFDTPPYLEQDRLLVPLRGILSSLGYTVHWQEHTQTVLALGEDVSISLQIDENTALVNGKTVPIDVPARIKNGRTFVPLRFLAEYSGAEVLWDGSTSTVAIHAKAASPLQKMKRSVVHIQTNRMQGSGIILSADGLIATNYHVIEGASTAQFLFSDGSLYQGAATVVGLDPQSDIALLQIPKTGLSPAPLAAGYTVGEAVSAVGSPGGKRNTVTTGVLKAYDRDCLSFSAPISQGSSGGGLFNAKGELLGMTSAYSEDAALDAPIYLAIPISEVMQVPRTLSLPLAQMKSYVYTPTAPQNVRVETRSDGYAYVSWSPVYGADAYRVYQSTSSVGPFTAMKNPNTGKPDWRWGFPHCFGIHTQQTCYLQISAIVNGKETPPSAPLRISK